MTEENKIIEVKNECFCQSKWFRKFLVTATGTFVGVFCALSLFAALHKPPVPPCPFGYGKMMRPPVHCYHHMKRHGHGEFKKFEKRDFKKIERRDFGEKPPVRPERVDK